MGYTRKRWVGLGERSSNFGMRLGGEEKLGNIYDFRLEINNMPLRPSFFSAAKLLTS